MSDSGRARESGFTLIEVLVALTILSIALGVLLQVFSSNLRLLRSTRSEIAATSLAESLLASIGKSVAISPGNKEGESPDGYRWRLRVILFGSDDDQKSWPAAVYAVSVSVLWAEGRIEKSVSLTTLRTAPKE